MAVSLAVCLSITSFCTILYVCNGGALCPMDWHEMNGHCYVYLSEMMTWENARAACELHNSSLIKIDDAEENRQVAPLVVQRETWLGGSDNLEEGNWTWADGSLVADLGQWFPGEPDNGTVGQDCMTFNARRDNWKDIRCDRLRKFVCEKEKTDISCGGDANMNISEYDGHCYALHHVRERWHDANHTCVHKYGGYLVKIENETEKKWLFEFIGPEPRRVYTGGNDIAKEGVWVWADGSPMEYQDWSPYRRENRIISQNCLSFYDKHDTRWTDDNCLFMKYPLCEMELQSVAETTTSKEEGTSIEGSESPPSSGRKGFCYIIKSAYGYTMQCD